MEGSPTSELYNMQVALASHDDDEKDLYDHAEQQGHLQQRQHLQLIQQL